MPERNIIVAIDSDDLLEVQETMDALRGHPNLWGFKLSMLFLQKFWHYNFKLFKSYRGDPFKLLFGVNLYFMPDEMTKACSFYRNLGADLITVVLTAGPPSIRAAILALGEQDIRVLGLTVLTAMTDEDSFKVHGANTDNAVKALAIMGHNFGIGHIMCSPRELEPLRRIPELENTTFVVPGIRPLWATHPKDHSRIMTPHQAMKAGGKNTILQIGSPITNADNPREALDRIAEEMNEA